MRRSAPPAVLCVLCVLRGESLAATGTTPEVTGATGLLQTTLGLALVLALIVAVAWVAKRFAPGTIRSGVTLPIIASQAVGQRERVVVVEIGGQWLVLGVAPGRVSSLGTLPKGELPSATPPGESFSSALARAFTRRD
jgi:flagellar protein FliO/FliZ